MTTLDPTDPRTDEQLLTDTGWTGFWDDHGRPAPWPEDAFDDEGNLRNDPNLREPARAAEAVIRWHETGDIDV